MIGLLMMPFLASIVLVLIHVYFGSFVLRRGVIFIDLALAQWAALGYLIGHWMDVHQPLLLFIMAFFFTVIASFILSILKPYFNKPNLLEAVIGVLYLSAITIATSILSSTGMEGHHLNEMLSGHLLFIQLNELALAYGLYAIVAIILIRAHRHFIANESRKWDLVFYLLFGLVVTSSVKMVGILLVFSYLVLPILSVILFTNNIQSQLKYGWMIGITSSLLGLLLSMKIDIPPSFSIIFVLLLTWLGCLLAHIYQQQQK